MKNLISGLALVIGLFFVSCHKDGLIKHITPPGTPSVYIAGYMNESGYSIAELWKNGTSASLSNDTSNVFAESVFVNGLDVYVAGFEDESYSIIMPTSIAKLWKNGVATTLPGSTYGARAYSVFVSGSDVYVAGEVNGTNGSETATLWKNGVASTLSQGTGFISPASVFVNGTDVYVAGTINSGNDVITATLWKNGVATSLNHHCLYPDRMFM
jgi:hypothetical protein